LLDVGKASPSGEIEAKIIRGYILGEFNVISTSMQNLSFYIQN
jgi:hypothetical protein